MPFRCCHSLRVGARWARHPRWLRPPAPPQPPIRRVRRRWVIKLLPRHRQWVSIVKYLQLPCDKVEQGDLILAGSIAAGFALGAKNRLLRPSRRAVVSPCFQCPKMASRCRLTLSTAGRIGSRSPLLNAPASARTHARHAGNFHRVPVAVRNAYDRCDSRHIAQANSVIRGLSCPCSPCCVARSVPRSGFLRQSQCVFSNSAPPQTNEECTARNAERKPAALAACPALPPPSRAGQLGQFLLERLRLAQRRGHEQEARWPQGGQRHLPRPASRLGVLPLSSAGINRQGGYSYARCMRRRW